MNTIQFAGIVTVKSFSKISTLRLIIRVTFVRRVPPHIILKQLKNLASIAICYE